MTEEAATEEMYSIDQIEEPLYSILYNNGCGEIGASDYEVLAYALQSEAVGEEAVQQYIEAWATDPENYPWETVIWTIKSAMEGQEAEGQEAEGQEVPADGAEGGGGDETADPQEGEEEGAGGIDVIDMGEGTEEEGQEGGTAAEDAGEINTEPNSEGHWPCSRCTFVNQVADAAICAVCRVARTCETDGPGFVERNAEGRTQLIMTSEMLGEANKNLRGQFKVLKYNSDSMFSGKKERIFEVDFFQREFKNLSTSMKESFALQAVNMYRVERNPENPKGLKMLFFKSSHPIDLLFQNSTQRQRFIELAALMRKSPVIWAPFFCRQSVKESIVRIEGNTVEVNGKKEQCDGVGTFVASRMPYEVLRVWAGTINLQNRSLPLAGPKLEEYCPLEHDVYLLGLQDIPASLRDGKQIQEYWTNFFGANYYILLNSMHESNTFAGIEGRRGDKNCPAAMIVVIKRTIMAKVANMDFVELVETGESGKKSKETAEVYGAICSFRVQESTVCAMMCNITPNLTDVNIRNKKLQALLSRINCGDRLVDISCRFDYFFCLGSMGYHTLPTDELHQQIASQVVMTDFQECTILAEMCLPDRVLFWHRPRSARANILQYSTAPHIGSPNINALFDMYVQRPYCYALCPIVPSSKIQISQISFNCDTLSSVRDPEVRIAADWFEEGQVIQPLKQASSRFNCNTVPPLIPVCPAYEFLRAQSVMFSMLGGAEGLTKGKGQLIASAVIPLRDMLIPDSPMTHSAFVLRHTTVIGILEVSVTYVTRK